MSGTMWRTRAPAHPCTPEEPMISRQPANWSLWALCLFGATHCGGGSPDNAGGTAAGAGGGSATGGVSATGGTKATGGSATGGSGGGAPVTANEGCSWVDIAHGHKSFYLGASPHKNRIYLPDSDQKKLFVSSDNGDTWTQLAATPTDGKAFDAIVEKMVWDPADTTDNTFWVGGMYGSAGIYHTTDGGKTFRSNCFEHIDSFSIDLADPEHKSIVASAHGGTPYYSLDGGVTCSPLLPKLQAADAGIQNGWVPYVIDGSIFLISSGGFGGTEGIWRTTDKGATWTLATNKSVAQDLAVGPDGTYVYDQFWNRGLLISTDQGVSWKSTIGYGTLESGFGITGTFIGDGRFVNIKATSKTGMEQLLISSDYTHFKNFLAPFPASAPGDGSIIGVVYSVPGNKIYTYSNQSGHISRCDL